MCTSFYIYTHLDGLAELTLYSCFEIKQFDQRELKRYIAKLNILRWSENGESSMLREDGIEERSMDS